MLGLLRAWPSLFLPPESFYPGLCLCGAQHWMATPSPRKRQGWFFSSSLLDAPLATRQRFGQTEAVCQSRRNSCWCFTRTNLCVNPALDQVTSWDPSNLNYADFVSRGLADTQKYPDVLVAVLPTMLHRSQQGRICQKWSFHHAKLACFNCFLPKPLILAPESCSGHHLLVLKIWPPAYGVADRCPVVNVPRLMSLFPGIGKPRF